MESPDLVNDENGKSVEPRAAEQSQVRRRQLLKAMAATPVILTITARSSFGDATPATFAGQMASDDPDYSGPIDQRGSGLDPPPGGRRRGRRGKWWESLDSGDNEDGG